MKPDCVCCLDLGTSHVKAALIDTQGAICALTSHPAPPLNASVGDMTFDAEAYREVAWLAIREIMTGSFLISCPSVAGGGSVCPMHPQLLADLLGRPIGVAPVPEATLLGVAISAWTGLGRFRSLDEGVRDCTGRDMRIMQPSLDRRIRDRLWSRYLSGIACVRQFGGA